MFIIIPLQNFTINEYAAEFLTADSQCVNGRSKAEGLTALHLAVQGETDNDRLVSVLLQHRHIDVDARDADEWTPLHHACYRGFYRTVVALQNADFCCRDPFSTSLPQNVHSNIIIASPGSNVQAIHSNIIASMDFESKFQTPVDQVTISNINS